MLNLAKCTVIQTKSLPINPSILSVEEGTAMVATFISGKLYATPSTGAAGERFLGVSQSRFVRPLYANNTVSTVVPGTAPYTVSLAKVPTAAADVKVYIGGTAATQAGAAAAGVYVVSGSTLTFAAADAGKTLEVIYRYALTVAEANMLYGGDNVNLDLSSGIALTLIDSGTVYVDNFALADTWTAGATTTVYLAANGKFTTVAGGTALDAIIVESPLTASGYLGLMLHP